MTVSPVCFQLQLSFSNHLASVTCDQLFHPFEFPYFFSGSCNVEGGLDRSWTIDQLEEKIKGKFPFHMAELNKTGIEFAKLIQYSKKISVHELVKGGTVADLEECHGCGILVILQKVSRCTLASRKKIFTALDNYMYYLAFMAFFWAADEVGSSAYIS